MPRWNFVAMILVVWAGLCCSAWCVPASSLPVHDPDVQTSQLQVMIPARPSDNAPNPASALAAQDWASMLIALASSKDWGPAMWVAPIGVRSFAREAVWADPILQQAWRSTLVARARQEWSVGADGRSMWRLANGEDPLRPSLGLVRQNDGSWWVVIAEPDSVDGNPTSTWSCPATGCSLIMKIQTPSITSSLPDEWDQSPSWSHTEQSVTLRHPDGRQTSGPTRVLGFSLRPSFAGNVVSVWSLNLPGSDQVWSWDLSFLPEICSFEGLSCPGSLLENP
jgi:hypothetical protein